MVPYQAQGERGERDLGDAGGVGVGDDGDEQLGQVLPLAARVGQPQPEVGGVLDGVGRALQVLRQQGQGRVVLQPHARRHDADGQQRAGADVLLLAVHELVDLVEALLHVPEQDGAHGGRGAHHAVVLVLVQPRVTLGRDERVLLVADVHEGVHEGRRQVGTRRVRGLSGPSGVATAPAEASGLSQVALVDVLRRLGLEHVQVLGEQQVVLAEPGVADQLVHLLRVRVLNVHVAAREDEGQLLPEHVVLHVRQQLHAAVLVAQRDGHPQRVREVSLLLVDLEGRDQHLVQVLGVRHVVRAAQQVEADALVVGAVDGLELEQLVQLLHLEQQVHGLGEGIVLDVERHDVLHQAQQLVHRLRRLGRCPCCVLLPDLASQ